MSQIESVESTLLFDDRLPADLDIAGLWEASPPAAIPCVDTEGIEDDEENSSPRKMRQSGGLLLRAHSLSHVLRGDVADQVKLQAVIDSSSRHFQRLRDLGMCVVTHLTIPNLKPVNWNHLDTDDELAYSASRFVDNSQPLYMTDVARTIDQEQSRSVLIDPLKAYLNWCEANREPEILSDIFTSNQYAKQMTTGIVYLADIDPIMRPLSEEIADEISEDLDDFGKYLHVS